MESLVSAFKGSRVLVTGHTGFKGSWLTLWLTEFGAEVYGYALPVEGNEIAPAVKDECLADIRNVGMLQHFARQVKPDYLFHLAAQAVVSEGYHGPAETWETNTIGTVNALELCRHCPTIKSAIMVTTDKVYRNENLGRSFREPDELGGADPYSSSKAAAELAVSAWRQSYQLCPISTVRAGNVIGGGDMAKDRLIPDCIRAFRKGEMPAIRNPGHVRPWQHVLEPIYGYLKLAAMQREDVSIQGAYNFGPCTGDYATVGDVVGRLAACWGVTGPTHQQQQTFGECKHLALEIGKAVAVLDWSPKLRLGECVRWTVEGYRGRSPVDQIREYMK